MLTYLLRRGAMLLVSVVVIAVLTFMIIDLPPGDYVSTYISNLQAQGVDVRQDEIAALKRRYGLDEPLYTRFVKWAWALLNGDYGMSFIWNRPVKELVGERMLLTVVISLSTLMFTWIVALPIGIFSATNQYSWPDYLVTTLSFIGRGIPEFMIALILMWLALSRLGITAGGLFSVRYRDAPWGWGKVVDLLKHLWLPMVVLGLGSTAGLIRTMRANLLDELHKPYVNTARAKGLAERRLLWKYPVRVALNPFVSTVGWSLPGIVSGSQIVGIVLSLPISGPLLLQAVMSQDTYLAASFLLFLSMLTLIGTFLSDMLLAWLDPRIRLGDT